MKQLKLKKRFLRYSGKNKKDTYIFKDRHIDEVHIYQIRSGIFILSDFSGIDFEE